MTNAKTIGEKVKTFRVRNNVSQEELEFRIGASEGSISRIESGKTNPTKETLSKIIEALKLNAHEAASFYNINSTSISNLIKICQIVTSSSNLDEVMQNSVNELAREFNFVGCMIAMIKGDRLFFTTVNESWYTTLAFKMLGKPFRRISYSLKDDITNYMVKSAVTDDIYITENSEQIGAPTIPPRICRLIAKMTNSVTSVVIPLKSNAKVIGVLTATKNYSDDFSLELPVLKAFADHIATVISKVEELKASR